MAKLWLVLAVCIGAAAFDEPSVYRPGPDVSAPLVVAKAPPALSDEARLAKMEGSVMVSLVVGADSQLRQIEVARPLGLGLDEKAIENVRAWRFKPGMKNGAAVAVRANVEVFFRTQRDLWDWHAVRAAFGGPSSARRPVLNKTKFPATVDEEENASVTMTFDVGPDGIPANVVIVKSSDPKWENGLLTAVRTGWRFEPGIIDGKPATVPAWFEFVRGSHSPTPAPPIPPTFIAH